MRDVFATQKASSYLIASVLVLAMQSSSNAQDGTQSQGSPGPAPSIAEDNGRERGGYLDPPVPAERSSARVEPPPVPGPADAPGQTSGAKMEPRKIPVGRVAGPPGFQPRVGGGKGGRGGFTAQFF